ncbi:MAG: polysaccharide deacetylase family protein [Verrucomicrobia bacterium]|nr:polysaccharide deacetylase family protein [Verrucomicrobiota bacterium]
MPATATTTDSIASRAGDGHRDPVPGVAASYTSLSLFRRWFAGGGVPALMYHKLGPRPKGVRLRGLYVDAALFRRQLGELAASGYSTVFPESWTDEDTADSRRIGLTFDDGFENVLRHGLGPLSVHGFQAIQYLVSGLLGKTNEWEQRQGEAVERLMDVSQVREWLGAGHRIGAHTRSHPWLTRIPLAEAREEIRSSKAMLEDAFGVPVLDFCYPYGDWNPAVRDVVMESGFRTACTTASGLNRPSGHRFQLRRLTARHTSLQWRTLGAWLRLLWAR